MKRDFGADIDLIASGGGAFEVVVDGYLVYSKTATGRHAEPGEVARLIRERA